MNMTRIDVGSTLQSLANMDMHDLVQYYWKISDPRGNSKDREEREQMRSLLLVIDAVGELQWPNFWHEKRHAI